MHDKASHLEFRPKDPTKEEYEMYTAAAKAAGLITEVVPYGATSHIVDMARRMRRENMDPEKQWYDLLFGDETSFSKISYDKRFCHILRAGLDDALVVLMVAMLPNVSEIYFDGTPADVIALPWKSPRYHFSKLRRLTAAAIDDTITWPLRFFNPILAEAKLETFEARTCSSWYYSENNDLEPLHLREVPLALQPGSLQLENIELVRSCLRPLDMECLVKACPQLRKFTLSSGDPDTDPYTITPALLIEVLESAKESLEELHFEIDCGELAEQFKPGVEYHFNHSFVQFKDLKVLSTPAEMWSGHLTDIDACFAERSLKEEERLCRRLPMSLGVLRSSLSDEESELPLIQLRDLCRTHAQTPPNLKRLLVGPTNDPNWLECSELIVSQEKEGLLAGQEELEVEVREPIKTAWDAFPTSSRLPDLKWFGTKYVIRKRKLSKNSMWGSCELRRIREQYRNLLTGETENEDGNEVSVPMGQVEVKAMLLRQVREHANKEVLYESADEEDPHGTPHLDDTDDS